MLVRGLEPDGAKNVQAGRGCREDEAPRDRPVRPPPHQAASDETRGGTPGSEARAASGDRCDGALPAR